LLDTSFFLDAVKNKDEFIDFKKHCKKSQIILVTIDPVAWEFTRGTYGNELSDRLAVMDALVDQYLPINLVDISRDHVPFLIEKYQRIGSNVSIVDFLLGALARKHSNDLCILTKNPKDFPLSFFELKSHLLLNGENFLQAYGVYSFKQKSFKSSKTKREKDVVPF